MLFVQDYASLTMFDDARLMSAYIAPVLGSSALTTHASNVSPTLAFVYFDFLVSSITFICGTLHFVSDYLPFSPM